MVQVVVVVGAAADPLVAAEVAGARVVAGAAAAVAGVQAVLAGLAVGVDLAVVEAVEVPVVVAAAAQWAISTCQDMAETMKKM